MSGLTHLDDSGAARMVDVSDKADTHRLAVARGRVRMSPAALDEVRRGDGRKGDVLGTARVAGIMAAKRTHELVPLCHPIALTGVSLELRIEEDSVCVRATARTTGPTGVEMEALTAASVACLTIYDMVKAVDRGMVIDDVRLLEKAGGRSGVWKADT